MKANDPDNLPEELADWIIYLVAMNPILYAKDQLASFMAYIADEEIIYLQDLTRLFEEWAHDRR